MKITLTDDMKDAIKWFYDTFPDVVFVRLACYSDNNKFTPRYPFKGKRKVSYEYLIGFLEYNINHGLGICPHSLGYWVLDVDNQDCAFADPEAVQYSSRGKNNGTHYWYPGERRSSGPDGITVCNEDHKCGDVKGSRWSYVHLRADNVVTLRRSLEPILCNGKRIDHTPPTEPEKNRNRQHERRPYRNFNYEELLDVAASVDIGQRETTMFALIAEYGYQNHKLIKAGTMPVEDMIEFARRCYDVIPDKTDLVDKAEDQGRRSYMFAKNVFGVMHGDIGYYEKAAELYEQRWSLRQIGDKLGKHHTTILNALKRQGIYRGKL